MTDKNPFDIDTAETPDTAETSETSEPKPKRTRRTKEQIAADKAAEDAAKEAEADRGAVVAQIVPADDEIDLNEIDFDAYPLSAVSGQVTGVIKLNGAVPILEIALIGWVGEAPVSIAADQIGDVEKILKDLRKAVKDAKKS